jgi:hypothetical protein
VKPDVPALSAFSRPKNAGLALICLIFSRVALLRRKT